MPKDLRTPDSRRTAMAALAEVVGKRFDGAPPLLSAEEDMSVSDAGFRKAQRRLESVEGLLSGHALARAPDLRPRLVQLQHKRVSALCGLGYKVPGSRVEGLLSGHALTCAPDLRPRSVQLQHKRVGAPWVFSCRVLRF